MDSEHSLKTNRFIRRLLGLQPGLRVRSARTIIENLPPAEAARILAGLLDLRARGDGKATDALSAVTAALAEMGSGDVASDIYAAAVELGSDEVRSLMMRPGPARRFDPRREHGVDREMRAKTVGFRKQMARTADPVAMMRLQTDPDASVIDALLEHPRLTEAEVVRMAARRPGRPEVLAEIFHSRKWSTRLMVRKALANNPYTPTEISLKLLPLLPRQALRELSGDGNLHEEVRESAARLLRQRRNRSSG